MDLSARSFYSGVVFPTTSQVYQCSDHFQEACQFDHAGGVPDIFSPEVRLSKIKYCVPGIFWEKRAPAKGVAALQKTSLLLMMLSLILHHVYQKNIDR